MYPTFLFTLSAVMCVPQALHDQCDDRRTQCRPLMAAPSRGVASLLQATTKVTATATTTASLSLYTNCMSEGYYTHLIKGDASGCPAWAYNRGTLVSFYAYATEQPGTTQFSNCMSGGWYTHLVIGNASGCPSWASNRGDHFYAYATEQPGSTRITNCMSGGYYTHLVEGDASDCPWWASCKTSLCSFWAYLTDQAPPTALPTAAPTVAPTGGMSPTAFPTSAGQASTGCADVTGNLYCSNFEKARLIQTSTLDACKGTCIGMRCSGGYFWTGNSGTCYLFGTSGADRACGAHVENPNEGTTSTIFTCEAATLNIVTGLPETSGTYTASGRQNGRDTYTGPNDSILRYEVTGSNDGFNWGAGPGWLNSNAWMIFQGGHNRYGLVTNVDVNMLCGLRGWQTRMGASLPVEITGCQQVPAPVCTKANMDVGGGANKCGRMPTILIISPSGFKPTWYNGETEKGVIAHAADCQARCGAMLACDYFRYDDGNQVCYLRQGYTIDQMRNHGGSCEPLYENTFGGTSGPKECLSCTKAKMDVGGAENECGYMPTILIISPTGEKPTWYDGKTEQAIIADADECQSRCASLTHCDYFRYDEGNQVCFLKQDYTVKQRRDHGGSCDPLYQDHFGGVSGPKQCLPSGCCARNGHCADCGEYGTGLCHTSKDFCAQCNGGVWDPNGTAPSCYPPTPQPTPSVEECEPFTDGICDEIDCFRWRGDTECKSVDGKTGPKKCRCRNYPNECAVRRFVFPFMFSTVCVPVNRNSSASVSSKSLGTFLSDALGDFGDVLSFHANNQSFR